MHPETQKTKEVVELFTKTLDERGLPLFGVIEGLDENGNMTELYKLESGFTAEDYQKAAEYQRKLAAYHTRLADYYSAGFEKRTKTK